MEVPLPWERLLWRGRPWLSRGEEYALTDVRLVAVAGARWDEIALHDIAEVRRVRSAIDRIAGTSTLVVEPRRRGGRPLVIRRVRKGLHLAALLELLASDPRTPLDPPAIEAALAWRPRARPRSYRELLAAVAILVVAVSAVITGLHGKPSAVVYAPDDPIYPGGTKRDHADIVAFMKTQVLPWARQAFAPVVGGADRVSCETCHSQSAEERLYRMPAVAALPAPDVTGRGWETYSDAMNAQMRNAIYGYAAESDHQAKATYMREIVMPGMARLLRRPPYDFTKPYDYNRTRNAFGCYHCHLVRE